MQLGARTARYEVTRRWRCKRPNEVLVDVDYRPRGQSPLWVMSSDGKPLTRIVSEYCRHHHLIDWTGDGYSEVVIGQSRVCFMETANARQRFASTNSIWI